MIINKIIVKYLLWRQSKRSYLKSSAAVFVRALVEQSVSEHGCVEQAQAAGHTLTEKYM